MSLRALQLLGIAARAEGLRFRRGAANGMRGMIVTGMAAGLGLLALLLLHLAAWLWLAAWQDALTASLLLALADALLAGLLLLLARPRPDPVAEAALLIRQEALREAAHAPLWAEAAELLTGRSATALAGGLVAEALRHALTRR
jgi:MFS family permease